MVNKDDNVNQPFITYDYKDKTKALTNFSLGMYNKTLTMFDYSELPDTIPFREVEKILQYNGYAIITEVKGELYAFYGGLSGFDAYYQPTHAVVANPYLNFNKTLRIGEDCVLIRNDDMKLGLHYLFQRYGYQIVENELTMILNNYNSRMRTIVTATDDNTAESAKEYIQGIQDGEIGVVMGSKLFDGLKVDSTTQTSNTSITDLIELEQYMKATLFNEIGLDANYNMKRERLSDGEVNQNDDALYPLVDNMLDNRKNGWQAVNDMFGTNISVDFSSIWKAKQETVNRQANLDTGESDSIIPTDEEENQEENLQNEEIVSEDENPEIDSSQVVDEPTSKEDESTSEEDEPTSEDEPENEDDSDEPENEDDSDDSDVDDKDKGDKDDKKN